MVQFFAGWFGCVTFGGMLLRGGCFALPWGVRSRLHMRLSGVCRASPGLGLSLTLSTAVALAAVDSRVVQHAR